MQEMDKFTDDLAGKCFALVVGEICKAAGHESSEEDFGILVNSLRVSMERKEKSTIFSLDGRPFIEVFDLEISEPKLASDVYKMEAKITVKRFAEAKHT